MLPTPCVVLQDLLSLKSSLTLTHACMLDRLESILAGWLPSFQPDCRLLPACSRAIDQKLSLIHTKYISVISVNFAITATPPTPRRYASGRREARPTHPSLVADGRHPPRERRAGTPSRGGAILGSLCPPNRQMACLSSSYTARERNFLLLTDTPRDYC